MGQRPPDDTAVCLCDGAHNDLHSLNGNGCFRGFTKQQIRELEDRWIAFTRQHLAH